MHELGFGIIADSASAHFQSGLMQGGQRRSVDADVYRHASQVVAVSGNAAARFAQAQIGRAGAIARNDLDRVVVAHIGLQIVKQIHQGQIHDARFAGIVVAQDVVDLPPRETVVSAVFPIGDAQPFVRMQVMERQSALARRRGQQPFRPGWRGDAAGKGKKPQTQKAAPRAVEEVIHYGGESA